MRGERGKEGRRETERHKKDSEIEIKKTEREERKGRGGEKRA